MNDVLLESMNQYFFSTFNFATSLLMPHICPDFEILDFGA